MSRKELLLKAKRIRKSGTGTDTQYEECIREHLPYEIGMLRLLYGKLLSKHGQLEANAFIESFFLHARNLVAFFRNDTDCGFDPRYFTKQDYKVAGNFAPAGLVKKVNQQIQHLGCDRTDKGALKLGPPERAMIYDLLEKEIERFERLLESPFRLECHVAPIGNTITVSMRDTHQCDPHDNRPVN